MLQREVINVECRCGDKKWVKLIWVVIRSGAGGVIGVKKEVEVMDLCVLEDSCLYP